jgi:biotin operon repressor
MNSLAYVKRINYLLEKIKKGSLHQMTSQFNCSERTIRNMINELRNEGYNIRYSRKEKKYLLKN